MLCHLVELEAEKSKWFGSTQLNFFILLPVALQEPARVGFKFSTNQKPLKCRSLKATQRSKLSEYTSEGVVNTRPETGVILH